MRAAIIALGALVAVVVVLGAIAQLVLPGIAASRLRRRIQPYGRVEKASLSAFPAVKLLWGKADSARLQMADLRISAQKLADLLWEARGIDRLQLSAAKVSLTAIPLTKGPLGMTDVLLDKRSGRLEAQASLSTQELAQAMPAGMQARLDESQGTARGPIGEEAQVAPGASIRLTVSGGLFGLKAAVGATLGPVQGRLVARPEGLVGQLVSVTLFSDPRVLVQGVRASQGAQGGYRIALAARLRG